jgi:DNA-binding CsgD family transcriptional regulator
MVTDPSGAKPTVRPEAAPAKSIVDDQRIARALGDLVAAIGTTTFPACLLDAMRALAGAELCSVFLRNGNQHVQLIFAHGERPGLTEFTLNASEAYARNYWRSDRQWARLVQAPNGAPIVVRRRACDIADPAYRAACYDSAGVIERVSILSPGRPCFAVNGYRTARSTSFGPQDIERLELHAGLLIAALRQHLRSEWAIERPIDEGTLARTFGALDCGLSRREAEIVAAMVLGETQDEIAHAKQLSTGTVVTYRRRAYGKLGVTNRRDLVALHRRILADPAYMQAGARSGRGLRGGE